MNCSSSVLSMIWCKVDKWKVTIMASGASTSTLDALTSIDVTLKYVANPAKGTTVKPVMLSIIDTDGHFTA